MLTPLEVLVWLGVVAVGLVVIGVLVVVVIVIIGASVGLRKMRDDDGKDEVIIEGRSRS